MKPGLYSKPMLDHTTFEPVEKILHSIVAVLATDDGLEPVEVRLSVIDGHLEVQETAGRRLKVLPISSNTIDIEVERRFPK